MLYKPPLKPKDIPRKTGVYIFKDCEQKPLYIGKTVNLCIRLQSYFKVNAPEKVKQLRKEAVSLEWEILKTEFDALIREAELIKKYRPKYNILLRDDKSYHYIEFSNNLFPRIAISHRPASKRALGPYTESGPLYAALKILRRVFPYCTCKKPHIRQCANAQMGLCMGICCISQPIAKDLTSYNKIAAEYRNNIKMIRIALTGKLQKIISSLKTAMQKFSEAQQYERAASCRAKIIALEQIYSHKHIIAWKNPFILDNAKTSAEMALLFGSAKPILRIEGYDVSMLGGKAAVASLAIFENGLPQKSEYKKFRIRGDKTQSDADMLAETVARRLEHKEWKLPDIMLIDGGMPQLRKVARVLHKKFGKNPPILLAGISKARHPSGTVRRKASEAELLHIYRNKNRQNYYKAKEKSAIPVGELPRNIMHLLQYIRDESHRFARAYHRKLRHAFF